MLRVFAEQSVDLKSLTPTEGIDTFGALVSIIVRNAFVVAGVLSFLLLIFGGASVIVAGGNTKQLEKGRGVIIGAVTGLLLVVGSFWMVQIIEKITGLNILTSPY